MNEKLIKFNFNRREITLEHWKSKLSYPFNYKELEELENIIDYYEGENKQLKERIDKATEFLIKYRTEWYQCDEVIDDMNQLLNILKGESNE